MNFQQASFERVAPEYEQATHDENHVGVAPATEMSRAEMWERMGALRNQAEPTWTSHPVTVSNEMNGVANDELENQRRNLHHEATTELEKYQRHGHEHLQEYQQGVRRHLSKSNKLPKS